MRRLLHTIAVGALLGIAVAVPAAPAHAEAGYNLRAQADGIFFEANYAGAPASPNNEAGSLTAAAELNSAGNSKAFAAAPYYGMTVQTLPGTVNGVLSGNGVPASVPLTSFPGYVSSRYPSKPSDSATQGHFRVSAKSGPDSSSASGENGAPPEVPAPSQQQVANASVVATTTGAVVSSATATVSGIDLGSAVTDFTGTSTLKVTQSPGGAAKVVSSSSGSFTVGGQGVTFDDRGFKLAGQAVPTKDGLARVNAILANSNTRIEAVPSTRAKDPGTGQTIYTLGALRFETANTVPTQSDAKLVWLLARVQVRSFTAAMSDEAGDLDVVTGPSGDETDVASDATAPQSGKDLAGAPVLSGGAGAPVLGETAVPSPTTVGASAGPAGPRQLGAVRSSALQGSESQLIYLVLVLGGLAVFAGQQLFSRFGIRLLLTATRGSGGTT